MGLKSGLWGRRKRSTAPGASLRPWTAGRDRNRIERMLGYLKHQRRIATRHDKTTHRSPASSI